MPELPEVEVTRRALTPALVGRVFVGSVLDWPKAVAHPSPDDFERALPGRRVVALGRRGKHLIIELDGGWRLIVHLRMTGRLYLTDSTAEPTKYTRNRLLLDGNAELRFVDLRKFGQLWLLAPGEDAQAPYAQMGPEPFDPAFTVDVLAARLQRRQTGIKAVLLDQHTLAGLGNIYVDEALFEARLHPEAPADRLRDADISRLHDAVISALTRGIANSGTSYRDFVGPLGERGSNQEDLRVWRREGQPCVRCGTRIIKMRVAGRGTHLCPNCQPLPTQLSPEAR